MPMAPSHDLRTSATHAPLLEVPGTLPYLPYALRWAFRVEVVSFALIFGTLIGVFAGFLVGLWIVILVGSGTIAWLLAVNARAVQGFGDPPKLDSDVLLTVGLQALRIASLAAMIIGAFLVLHRTNPALALVFAYTAGALLPPALALLANEDSLVPVLNPARVAPLLLFGGPFAWSLSVGAALGMGAALPALARFTLAGDDLALLVSHAPGITKIIGAILAIWVAAVLMHLYGHALHHRHERVGLGVVLDAADDDELCASRLETAIAAAAEALAVAARAGDGKAARAIVGVVPDGIDKLGYLSGLWETMRVRHEDAAAVLVARFLVPSAVAAKRFDLAREVWMEARRLSPSFELVPEVHSMFLAQAHARRDGELVRALSATSATTARQ